MRPLHPLRRGVSTACLLLATTAAIAACGAGSDDQTAIEPVASEEAAPASEGGEASSSVESLAAAVAMPASCEEIAAAFQTQGSANADLPDPEVQANCDGDTVVVTSNQIPDFPYIETSPGNPRAFDLSFTIPATPVVADVATDVAAIGPIGVAINGVPIYGATEGTGGDVKSMPNGFTECGGHNGPTGYHFHTFDVTGSDVCMVSEAEAKEAPVLFGYAFDGYPIFGGIFQYTSSFELTDASLFATDTRSAHTYVEGFGDLDECNGLTDANGNYAYYATETYPYTLSCYRGVFDAAARGGEGEGGGGGQRGEGPPPGGAEGGTPPSGEEGERPQNDDGEDR